MWQKFLAVVWRWDAPLALWNVEKATVLYTRDWDNMAMTNDIVIFLVGKRWPGRYKWIVFYDYKIFSSLYLY